MKKDRQLKEPQTNAEKPSSRVFPLWIVALGSGLFAGSLAAFGGELTYQALHKEPEYPASFASLSSSDRAIARGVVRFNTKVAVDTNKATAAYGLLGATLGVVLGLAGGLAGRFHRASLRGAAIGGLLGCVAGAALSMVLVPLFFQASDAITALPLLFVTQGAIFAGIGAASGAALGWEWGERKVIIRCAIGGAVGAMIGTLVALVLNIATFGIMRIFEPVPAQSLPRFVVHLCVALTRLQVPCSLAENAVPGHPESDAPVHADPLPSTWSGRIAPALVRRTTATPN